MDGLNVENKCVDAFINCSCSKIPFVDDPVSAMAILHPRPEEENIYFQLGIKEQLVRLSKHKTAIELIDS